MDTFAHFQRSERLHNEEIAIGFSHAKYILAHEDLARDRERERWRDGEKI